MYHHLSQYYDQLFPWNRQIEELIKPYIVPSGQAIDLGCGTGRLTYLLDQLGMHVVGIDLDQDMIKVAQENYPHLSFFHDDMISSLKTSKTFSLMTCFGNTLPHLTLKDLRLFLESVHQSLTEDGVLIVQLLNYTKILNEKPKHLKVIENDDIKFSREYSYLENQISFKTVLKFKDNETVGTTTLYPYQKEQLITEIELANLKVQAYGDFNFKPFDEQDYYLYLIISKK